LPFLTNSTMYTPPSRVPCPHGSSPAPHTRNGLAESAWWLPPEPRGAGQSALPPCVQRFPEGSKTRDRAGASGKRISPARQCCEIAPRQARTDPASSRAASGFPAPALRPPGRSAADQGLKTRLPDTVARVCRCAHRGVALGASAYRSQSIKACRPSGLAIQRSIASRSSDRSTACAVR
jgi:hypothetical protein